MRRSLVALSHRDRKRGRGINHQIPNPVKSVQEVKQDRHDEDGKQQPEKVEYKNVYISPAAYREYVKTRTFPQGTVLVLESATGETKNEPGLRGSFQKEFVGLLAAVKDRDRFEGGWAYYRFTDKPGKLLDKANPSAKSACFDCHQQKGAEDNVFTQYYPVLRAIPKK